MLIKEVVKHMVKKSASNKGEKKSGNSCGAGLAYNKKDNLPESVTLSEMREIMKGMLQIDPACTAIVTVDMHRGHLDPSVATMPCAKEDCHRVVKHAKDVLDFARKQGVPIIHVILALRRLPIGNELMNLPFNQYLTNVSQKYRYMLKNHNREGSVQTQIMPDLYEESDYVIDNKKTLDSFYETDLELLLRCLGIDTTVIIGINTNTCVQNACFSASARGFKVVAISDCTASMYAPELHTFGLMNIGSCLGWVLTVEEFKQKVLASKC